MDTASQYHLWLPIDASADGGPIDSLIVWTHVFMVLLFVGWGIYFVHCLRRFRAREGHDASAELPKAKPTKYVEIAVIAIEAILLIGLSRTAIARVRDPNMFPKPEEALTVRVVAQQFEWTYHYPGKDGEFGPTKIELIDDTENILGLDRIHPDARDDIVAKKLTVPVNKKVVLRLSSKDVIHSLSIPYLRVKQDVIPGMEIPTWFQATMTSDQVQKELTRKYPVKLLRPLKHMAMEDVHSQTEAIVRKGKRILNQEVIDKIKKAGKTHIVAAPADAIEINCAQLCGIQHYKMRGVVDVVTAEEYQAWLVEETEYALELAEELLEEEEEDDDEEFEEEDDEEMTDDEDEEEEEEE
jgi:cytochrome c oxidase subunit 2